MSVNLEIERKFLVRDPDPDLLNIKDRFDILQTYLENGENDSQRRVRKISENNKVTYMYTEKIFYSPTTRKETEYEITEAQYNDLLTQAKKGCKPIKKCRICFEYKDQLFEMDIYDFSDKFAILELELKDEAQEIFFPEYIDIIKEVTGVEEYSNAALGTARAFPSATPQKAHLTV